MSANIRRWGDNDRRFGPLTYARDRRGYRPIAMVLSSAEEEYPGCNFRMSAFGHTLIVELPAIIKPSRNWVDTSHYEWSNNRAGGYWNIDKREYGFSLSEGFLDVSLGRATNDSSTEQRWGYFLPWTQWRHVRHSFYGLNGEHVATLPDTGKSYLGNPGRFERERAVADATPAIAFEFNDFDGERIVVVTKIEEREWRFGTGWFKWLSAFRRPKVRRTLDLQFSSETGRKKGSWKGGTIGHGIEMLAGELHEAAFRRYCVAHEMTFIGPGPVPGEEQ